MLNALEWQEDVTYQNDFENIFFLKKKKRGEKSYGKNVLNPQVNIELS